MRQLDRNRNDDIPIGSAELPELRAYFHGWAQELVSEGADGRQWARDDSLSGRRGFEPRPPSRGNPLEWKWFLAHASLQKLPAFQWSPHASPYRIGRLTGLQSSKRFSIVLVVDMRLGRQGRELVDERAEVGDGSAGAGKLNAQ
jgi:hypothetical protein